MTSLNIKILFSFIITAVFVFVFLPLSGKGTVYANPSDLGGHIYLNYNGQQYPVKKAFVFRWSKCDSNGECKTTNTNFNFYSRDDGRYSMAEGSGTVYQNGQYYDYCPDEGRNDSCGINCGENDQRVFVTIPDEYDTSNFPYGIDFRKGHWKVRLTDTMTGKGAIKVDSKGDEYWLGGMGNGESYNGLNFEWIPDPLPVSGRITDSSTGEGISGASITIQNDKGETKSVSTDSAGKFSLSGFIDRGKVYAVRINKSSLPYGYLAPPKTVTTQWSWNSQLKVDTPSNSESYEFQMLENGDCSGPAADGSFRTGRCNFSLDPDPSVIRTPNPSSTVNPDPSGLDTASPTPDPDMPELPSSCVRKPTDPTATVVRIIAQNKNMDISGRQPLRFNFPVDALSRRPKDLNIPVIIVYSDGTCRPFIIKVKYSPPTPEQCRLAANKKPNGCPCITKNECEGGACNSENVCENAPFIQTTGGDVHSNENIDVQGQ